jgi:hypothetical protein
MPGAFETVEVRAQRVLLAQLVFDSHRGVADYGGFQTPAKGEGVLTYPCRGQRGGQWLTRDAHDISTLPCQPTRGRKNVGTLSLQGRRR